MSQLLCRACGTPVSLDEPIPRDAECAGCRRDLRCCMNCRHYDTAYNNSCRETMADPVEDKARRNFCEYFSFDRTPWKGAAGTSTKEAEARSKLASLFGSKAAAEPDAKASASESARRKLESKFEGSKAPDRADQARRKLDELFRKEKPREPDR